MAKDNSANTSVSSLKNKERKRIKRRWHWGTLRHILLVLFTLVLALAVVVVMVLAQCFNGPSRAARTYVTQILTQSSALKFVPDLFMLTEEVDEAIAQGSVIASDEVTDVSLITVRAHETKSYTDDEATEEQWDENGIRVEEVNGGTYHGYMMIVQDPSRVFVGTCAPVFDRNKAGLRVDEMMEKFGAVAGINAGAFYDANGAGTGGQALGLVYSQGEYRCNALNQYSWVAGFDKNDILHVGEFTKQEADELELRDACAFGPALVINGVPSVSDDKGPNPRTAIGQRADGAVLLLVIDGRQANSLGATIGDMINVMMDYGAVNACNMDGGSSTIMYYGKDKVNDGMTVSVSRKMPTAWLVK